MLHVKMLVLNLLILVSSPNILTANLQDCNAECGDLVQTPKILVRVRCSDTKSRYSDTESRDSNAGFADLVLNTKILVRVSSLL